MNSNCSGRTIGKDNNEQWEYNYRNTDYGIQMVRQSALAGDNVLGISDCRGDFSDRILHY